MTLREQVEFVIAAADRRDFDALARSGLLHEELEFISRVSTDEGIFRGIEGLRRWAAAVDETWEHYRIEVLEMHEVGAAVVALFRLTGVARASRVPLDVRAAQVWEWRDGLLWRNTAYESADEAFRAAGAGF